jgi:hypothetical protein
VAQAKKPHTIADELVLPAAVDMCETLLGKQCDEKLKAIPLSDNTVSRSISEVSQLVERIGKSKFALQHDESRHR